MTNRPQTSRSGIIAARHQRVLSAKKSRQQAADDAEQTRPGTAAVRRPMTASSRPGTAAVSSRRTSSSMDSVTFESERNQTQRLADRQCTSTSPSSPVASCTTVPTSDTTILTIDDDDDYEQVRQKY